MIPGSNEDTSTKNRLVGKTVTYFDKQKYAVRKMTRNPKMRDFVE